MTILSKPQARTCSGCQAEIWCGTKVKGLTFKLKTSENNGADSTERKHVSLTKNPFLYKVQSLRK
jgi:hypothetical protein